MLFSRAPIPSNNVRTNILPFKTTTDLYFLILYHFYRDWIIIRWHVSFMTSSTQTSASRPVVYFASDDLQTNRRLSIESSFAVHSQHIFLDLQLSSAYMADAIQLFTGCLFVISDSEQTRPRPVISLCCLSEVWISVCLPSEMIRFGIWDKWWLKTF
jgi:hypothetical protein